jgi:hypothetical protein
MIVRLAIYEDIYHIPALESTQTSNTRGISRQTTCGVVTFQYDKLRNTVSVLKVLAAWPSVIFSLAPGATGRVDIASRLLFCVLRLSPNWS